MKHKRKMFHTQEKRRNILKSPIECTAKNAWLGDAFYFWDEEVDAIHWGNNSKRKTSRFQIYSAEIVSENILDTVFNEEAYLVWKKAIEKAIKKIHIKTRIMPTIEEVNNILAKDVGWQKMVDGILFQDTPYSKDLSIKDFNYRKRIQLAVYNSNIINNFALHDEMECI